MTADLAPVDLEAFEGLRQEHAKDCYLCLGESARMTRGSYCYLLDMPPPAGCDCGVDAHNARVDAARAAHAAALAEVAELRRELAAANEDARRLAAALTGAMSRGHVYALCGGNGCIPPCVGVQVAIAAHRARVGGGK